MPSWHNHLSFERHMCLRARDQIIGCFLFARGLIKIREYRQEI